MSSHPSIRNINNLTTGDKVDFEILHGGEWKAMTISGTALNKIDGSRQRERDVAFAENLDAIAKIATAKLYRDPLPTDLLITSDDF